MDINSQMTEFEANMQLLGVLNGCMTARLHVSGKVEYLNEHVQWMWLQFRRAKGYLRPKLSVECPITDGGKVRIDASGNVAPAPATPQHFNCEFKCDGATFHANGAANPITYVPGGALVDLSGWTCYAPGVAPVVALTDERLS